MNLWDSSSACNVGTAVVVPPVTEVLTVADGKLRAGLDWPDGDPRDKLMAEFIAAARAKVEWDTYRALATQTHDVFYGPLVNGNLLPIPARSMPLQSVTSVTTTDAAGVASVLDPATYVVDLPHGYIIRRADGVWPTDAVQWVVRLVCGPEATAVPPLLLHAMGLLTAHYATLGRDLASLAAVEEMPQGYDDAIAPYVPVALA